MEGKKKMKNMRKSPVSIISSASGGPPPIPRSGKYKNLFYRANHGRRRKIMNKVKTILNNIKEFTKEHKKAVIIAASVLVLSVLAIGGTVYMMNQNNQEPKTSQTNGSGQAKESKKDDKKDNKQDKKNDQKKDDKKDSKNDKKADEKKNDVKENENKTETSNNSGNTNYTNNSTSTVKPSNNTSTNNTTTTTKPSNTTTSNNTSTATNNNSSSNNSSSQPTGCTPVYETVTVTDVPAQPIYGEEQYLISAEEPIYEERTVFMTSDGVQFETNQQDELVDYCLDHSVSYYVTTVKTQVGTKPAQYGTRQVVTGYTEPVTHTEQRQVDCK